MRKAVDTITQLREETVERMRGHAPAKEAERQTNSPCVAGDGSRAKLLPGGQESFSRVARRYISYDE